MERVYKNDRDLMSEMKRHNVVFQYLEDTSIKDRRIRIQGKNLLSFASCNYLGLEHNERVKERAKEMLERYGTGFATSRAYYGLSIIEELEDLLGKIFERPTMHTTSTSLGHVAALPILVGRNDAVIFDQHVHTSVRNAILMCKGMGTYTEPIRHNRVDLLEKRVLELRSKYEKIWYMADGVYSMQGETIPILEVKELLDRYEQLNVYVDDAHGMSWYGKKGCGYILGNIDYHPRIFLATSLGKGFGSFGGALVCHDEAEKETMRRFGSTLIFSTPNMPAVLGASIASAEIHLSDEIYLLQKQLRDNVAVFIREVEKYELPLLDNNDSPIFLIGVGKPNVGLRIMRLLIDGGFYPSLAIYPSMPYNNTGIRITINTMHTEEQIVAFVKKLTFAIERALKEENSSFKEIQKFFKLEPGKEPVPVH